MSAGDPNFTHLDYFTTAFRNGRAEDYPLCCVLHYAIVAGLTKDTSPQAVHRGGFSEPDGREWVACFFHRRRATPYPYPKDRLV